MAVTLVGTMIEAARVTNPKSFDVNARRRRPSLRNDRSCLTPSPTEFRVHFLLFLLISAGDVTTASPDAPDCCVYANEMQNWCEFSCCGELTPPFCHVQLSAQPRPESLPHGAEATIRILVAS